MCSLCEQLAAATDRIGSLQEEQQQLKQQNELIRERSEKSVEVGQPFKGDEILTTSGCVGAAVVSALRSALRWNAAHS